MPHTQVPPPLYGRVRMHVVAPEGRGARKSTSVARDPIGLYRWRPASGWEDNTVLYEWAAIVGNLMALRDPRYCVSGMYLEFANKAGPVAAPSYGRGGGSAYYNGLSGSPDTDYLRVPLIGAPLSTDDETNFPKGNTNTFYAMSRGAAGVHGKPFTSGAGSIVYGGALVAMVDPADPAQDLVLSRYYVSSGAQVLKPSGLQVGLEWAIKWQ